VKRLLCATFLLTVIASASSIDSLAQAKPSEKQMILERCKKQFGTPVDENQNLFEVNKFYVLRVKFGKRDKIEELAVEPKYFLQESHPEWEEPDNFAYLSKSEYESLLIHLDTIKPKGALVKPAPSISFVTNMTAPHKENYEHAVLRWGEIVDLRRGENAPLEVRYIQLTYR
jgi:hypothetical protein